jgi:hypothetical protein
MRHFRATRDSGRTQVLATRVGQCPLRGGSVAPGLVVALIALAIGLANPAAAGEATQPRYEGFLLGDPEATVHFRLAGRGERRKAVFRAENVLKHCSNGSSRRARDNYEEGSALPDCSTGGRLRWSAERVRP